MNRLKRIDFKGAVSENKGFILGIILISLFLFSDCLFGEYKLSFSSLMYNSVPFSSLSVETDGPWTSDIADSEYPSIYDTYYSDDSLSLWNNKIVLGMPTGTVENLLNPFNWFYLLPMEIAIVCIVLAKYLCAFFSMYLFMRAIGTEKFSASIAGIVYTFSAVLVVWLGWAHSTVAALAPLLFYAIEKLIQTIKVKYVLLISLTVYVMLVAGMPTYAAYFLYLAGLYIVIFTIKRYWKDWHKIILVGVLFAVGILLAALLSLPYTYSLLGSVGTNGYSESRGSYAEARLDLEYLRTMLFPNIREGFSANVIESTVYAGLLPIVMLPFTLINRKGKKKNLFFLLASVVIFLLIFTDYLTPFFKLLPLVNTSLKVRVITLLMFTLAVLAGISVNDIIVNRPYYRERKWLFTVPVLWCGVILGYSAFYMKKEGLLSANLEDCLHTAGIVLIIAVCLIALMRKQTRLAATVLIAVVAFDGSSFAKEYFPLISKEADVIPEATDSVQYMSDNTEDNERVVGLGNWLLFPNTPSYYGLSDIRGHCFTVTNGDIETYYQMIDADCYASSTRVEFYEIDNYELLKYLGIKYVYGSAVGEKTTIASYSEEKHTLGVIENGTVIRQEISVGEEGLPDAIQLVFATYTTAPDSDKTIVMTLYDSETGEMVAHSSLPISRLVDNGSVCFSLDTEEQAGAGNYIVEVSIEDTDGETFTLWIADREEETITVNGETHSGSLIMDLIYNSDEVTVVYEGEDSLVVGELSEYADKAELIETVLVYGSDEEVLNAMAEDYEANTIHVTEDTGIEGYDQPLEDGESVEVLEYSDDYVKISCNTAYDRYLSLNDYDQSGWHAYVNGEEVGIETVNYLMRGVLVPAGENVIIEFKYEPTEVYVTLVIFSATGVLMIALFFLRKRLQKLIEGTRVAA
ncbi:MAG: YfhO family protein [Lachnospiraceae bacterium]|nr:YfhO family protein [Lachnospiraceae bacterium]